MTHSASCPPVLAELQDALIDESTLNQWFRDLEQCTEITEIIPKFAARTAVVESAISLSDARDQLVGKQLRGVQVRYRYLGAEWWDTVLAAGAHFRLVRIRHEFSNVGD